MADKFRPLTSAEINKLTAAGCTCRDWTKVHAADGFDPDRLKATHFSGDIRLGVFQKEVQFDSGLTRPAGIYNAALHNCHVGSNVYINQVRGCIANYQIDDDCIIENIDQLVVQGRSSFGNGTEVAVINEAGGREIPIYDRLTAQLAYVIALYRHRPKLIEKLRAMIARYVESITSSMGLVGTGAKIINAGSIKNVKVGPAAIIDGAIQLENGSINSSSNDPVYIGPDISAHNFILSSGSKVIDGVLLSNCFVGQATVLAKQFSALNSVFFANCACYHGEACSIFAGPYTITHHKSTLLIAGLFSFFNAGSGTNQSNHSYKLGPAQQGIVERGAKTGSGAYIMWPAKVGAFATVLGRHYSNFDTSDLPFSYLIEHQNQTVLVPAANLKSIGTIRDAKKWPQRDSRKDPEKLDLINFTLLNPYTVGKMLNALEILHNLKTANAQTDDYYTWKNTKIKKESLDKGIKLYQLAIDTFLGSSLLKQLENKQFTDTGELRLALKPQTIPGAGKWLDLAGLLIPEVVVTDILDDIESGKLPNLDSITKAFVSAHESYSAYEWAWAANTLQQKLGMSSDALTPADVIEMIEKCKAAVVELDNKLLEDIKKEFAPDSQIGFGIDGNHNDRTTDFAAVRGTYDDNSVVKDIKKHIEEKSRLADDLISKLQKIR
jgi:hypothetical protein